MKMIIFKFKIHDDAHKSWFTCDQFFHHNRKALDGKEKSQEFS